MELMKEITDESKQYDFLIDKMIDAGKIGEPPIPYGTSVKKEGEYTVEDYFSYEGNELIELIYGKYYRRNYPSLQHQRIVSRLSFRFQSYIDQKRGKCEVFVSGTGVVFSEKDAVVLQPDMVVVCNEDIYDEKWGIAGPPELVIEVVSPSNRNHDLYTKLQLYLKYGVEYYLIIDPEKERVIFYDFKEGENPFICGFENSFKIPLFEELEICINDILGAI